MAQVKYDAYVYADESELMESITESGYILNGGEPLETENIITDTDSGEHLDMHYNGIIVLNYPITDSNWQPEFSTDVYMLCARKGNIKLPSNKKLKGNNRKYFYNYISRYAGEETI